MLTHVEVVYSCVFADAFMRVSQVHLNRHRKMLNVGRGHEKGIWSKLLYNLPS